MCNSDGLFLEFSDGAGGALLHPRGSSLMMNEMTFHKQ